VINRVVSRFILFNLRSFTDNVNCVVFRSLNILCITCACVVKLHAEAKGSLYRTAGSD